MRIVRYDKYTKCCSECQRQYTISCVYSLHAKRPLIVACTVNSLFMGNPGSDTFVLFFEISVSDGNIDIGFFPQVTLQIKLGVIKNVSAVVKPVVENKAPCLFLHSRAAQKRPTLWEPRIQSKQSFVILAASYSFRKAWLHEHSKQHMPRRYCLQKQGVSCPSLICSPRLS